MSSNSEEKINPIAGDGNASMEEVKKDFTSFWGTMKNFIVDIFDISHKTDKETTITMIKEDIPFKGHTAWIMICSTLIASVGLNANSAPVIIGAMLISPLMGPILGIGLSIAINDIDTLRSSLKNFLVMIVLSVFASFLFFRFFPLREESSELLARTYPDIRDVLIAFFGGLALIIARTKEGTIASVIFGVAISTALMPPLCTAGFGLAIWNLSYFTGAMYLFVINTIFIAMATYIVLKFLRFPMVRYLNSVKRRRTSQIASFVAFLVMVPAVYTFYNVFRESLYERSAKNFIEQEIKVFELPKGGIFLENVSEIDYNGGENSSIDLVFMGDDVISQNVINTWNTKKNNYDNLKNTSLNVIQGERSESESKLKYVQELYETKKAQLVNKDQKIKLLEDQVSKLSDNKKIEIPFQQICDEAKIHYPDITSISYSDVIKNNFEKLDTLPIFSITWKEGKSSEDIVAERDKVQSWLRLKLNDKKVEVTAITVE